MEPRSTTTLQPWWATGPQSSRTTVEGSSGNRKPDRLSFTAQTRLPKATRTSVISLRSVTTLSTRGAPPFSLPSSLSVFFLAHYHLMRADQDHLLCIFTLRLPYTRKYISHPRSAFSFLSILTVIRDHCQWPGRTKITRDTQDIEPSDCLSPGQHIPPLTQSSNKGFVSLAHGKTVSTNTRTSETSYKSLGDRNTSHPHEGIFNGCWESYYPDVGGSDHCRVYSHLVAVLRNRVRHDNVTSTAINLTFSARGKLARCRFQRGLISVDSVY